MRKRINLLILVLLLALLSGCAEEAVIAPELMEPVGVQSDMATAYIGEIYDIVTYDSAVVPYVEGLYFEVDGSIAEINIYPGKLVEEGEILLELDQTSLLEQAEKLRTELEYAERDNAYSDALAELDIEILQTELEQLRAQRADKMQIALKENEIAQKQAALRQTQELREPDLEVKRKQLEEISESLDKNVLRAPFSGRIVYGKQLGQRSWITAYDPVLFLADDSQLSLRGEYISESALMTASRLYARIGAQDYELERIPIDQEEYISMILSGATMYTEFEILGPQEQMGLLQAGQYAAVCAISGYKSDVLLVPSGAVLKDATGRYVYVDKNGERERRMVKVGKTTDALAEIIEGIEEGEVVYVKD